MTTAYLVEDDPKIRASLAPASESLADVKLLGFADCEDDAVAWLIHHGSEPDFVILDVYLRQGTGLGVLSSRSRLPSSCRFFVLTNSATPEVRARCAALGAEAVCDKTAELEEFFERCRSSRRY